MPSETASHSVMEGQGAYNKHAAQQAAGGASALPLLERAAERVVLPPPNNPVVVVDYGSSQGKNSLRPMRAAIGVLRRRLGDQSPISVVHTDLPGNDFSSLFNTLEDDPESYLRDQSNLYASAVGRSFYNRLFPDAYVTLGWSAYSVLWPSRVPALIPGHFYSTRSTGTVLEAFNRQLAEDWRTFLSHRAKELRPGGRLVILTPSRDDNGLHGTEALQDHANDVLAALVGEGFLSAAERERMVLTAHPKSLGDLMEPFTTGSYQDLVVEHCDVTPGPDSVWAAYEHHQDPARLAAQHAAFFRITFGPTLASALDEQSRIGMFYQKLEQGITRRVAADPVETRAVLGTMVIAKD
ncbi:MAG TPA: hypothetical protein VMD98_07750 [Bryocella sp.]|nr:hypothetical protein [Bryocella sp.]